MNSQETSEWQRMLFSLDLVDTFSLPNFLLLTNKKFSWSNEHLDNSKREVKLDRLYIDKILARKGGMVGLVVHLIMYLTMWCTSYTLLSSRGCTVKRTYASVHSCCDLIAVASCAYGAIVETTQVIGRKLLRE